MKILNFLDDKRIQARNYLIEISVAEYLSIARSVIQNNEFQRRRVSSSSTIYTLLKEDFRRGCVLPPIVLALGEQLSINEPAEFTYELLKEHIHSLVILDGLQRTYTLIDLIEELTQQKANDLNVISARSLRVEIYVGLNRLGILYRMLTLNTGQTPMSLRQQIEMLYLDFTRTPIAGISLKREVDEDAQGVLGEYSFKAVVEGFNSYVERTELPIDRFDILESIKSLESLSREDVSSNLFPDFITTYHSLVERLTTGANSHEFTAEELEIKGQPFGKNIRQIFSKSQALTGFGAAVGRLRDRDEIVSFKQISEAIASIPLENVVGDISTLLQRLEQIRLKAKKIGNAQRLFFHFLFRQLLSPHGDAYCKLGLAIETAYSRYETEMM